MSRQDLSSGKPVILVDTNVIIEAVRTHSWKALTGGRTVETVEECRDEALRGDTLRHDYVSVTGADLQRLNRVYPVTAIERATFAFAYPDAETMHPGERDLFAHAYQRMADGDTVWVVSSPDKSSVRAAVGLGWGDRMHSLEVLMRGVGTKPNPHLDFAHTERWLSDFRTAVLLGR